MTIIITDGHPMAYKLVELLEACEDWGLSGSPKTHPAGTKAICIEVIDHGGVIMVDLDLATQDYADLATVPIEHVRLLPDGE